MKKIMAFLLVISVCLTAAFTCAAEDTSAIISGNEGHRIIIDTDTAGDDATAILMAIKAPNITVEGITVLGGNVPLDQAVQNALMCVEVSGQTDIPVYRGSETTYSGTERLCYSVYGNDGMGDADLIHPTITAQEGSAVDFILNTVRENPGEIDLVCIGPVTNIALAIDKEPETMEKVRAVYVMGTSGFGPGNATPVAEFNVYHDAEAFARLLATGISMTVIGLDMCSTDNVVFYPEQGEVWENDGGIRAFLANSWSKLYAFDDDLTPNGYIQICDAVAMYAVIYDDAIISTAQCSGTCITDSSAAYGEVIFYKQGMKYDSMPQINSYKVNVVTKMNDEPYHDRLDALLSSY